MPAPKRPSKPKLITLDTIAPVDINWLWEPYIPAGTVTALYGRGGMGKSFITCDLASRMSRGEALPDGVVPEKPQKVLMLSAEDDYPSILVPRLLKQGADLTNIAVPDKQFVLDSAGINQLASMMAQFAATMVFIDPIVYYAGGKMDMNKSNEVRSMMEKLKEAAAAVKSTVVIVGHIRKSQEGADGDMMMGSADWINAARSSLFATKTNDGTKVLKHTKTNYGEIGLARSYHIDNDGLHWDEVFDEDDLPTQHPASKAEEAEVFLRTLLADGPVYAKEVELAAKDNGISTATLNRVKPKVAESFYSRSAEAMMWKLKE